MYQLHVRAIRTADDDGTSSAAIIAAEIVPLVATANAIFGAAGVEFVFDPVKDFTHINNTLLNRSFTVLDRLQDATDPNVEPRTSEMPNFWGRLRLSELFLHDIVVFFSANSRLTFDASQGHWVMSPGSTNFSSGSAGT